MTETSQARFSRACAWCTRILIDGVWVSAPRPEGKVSDGICPECEAKVRAEYGIPSRAA